MVMQIWGRQILSPTPQICLAIRCQVVYFLLQMITDAAFGNPWNRQLLRQSSLDADNQAYAFVFNYRGRNSVSLVPEWMGWF